MQSQSKGFVVTLFEVLNNRAAGRSRLVFSSDRVAIVRTLEAHAKQTNEKGHMARMDLAKPSISAFLDGRTDSVIVAAGPGFSGTTLCAYVDPCEVA